MYFRGSSFWHRHGPGVFMFGFGPWSSAWSYRSRREILRELEEYKKELEQELENINERIRELKRDLGEV